MTRDVVNMARSGQVRAAAYCRVSLARFGDTTSVDDQERRCREVAEVRGWTIVTVHKDNSKSAWRRGVRRPGWEALLAQVEAGEIDAIINYWGDRLVRQPRDMEDLLDAAEAKGVRIASVSGEYNLDNPDHQMMLRNEATRAKNEIDHLSRRLKEGHQRRRERGLIRAGGRGGRAFGMDRNNELVAEEVVILREFAHRVLAGETVRSMCHDLHARGIRTTAGNPFESRSLKSMLMRPRYAGLLPDEVTPAAWGPIYDDDPERAVEIWQAVCAVLSRRAGATPHTTARKWQLSGVAKCGTCGQHKIKGGRTNAKGTIYRCRNEWCEHPVARHMERTDALVDGVVLRLLHDPRLAERVDVAVDEQLAADLAILETRKEGVLEELADADEQSRKDIMRVTLPRLNERIAAKEAKLAEQRATHELSSVIGISRAEWKALPPTRRAAVIAQLVDVTILPTRRGNVFDPGSVRILPTGIAEGLDSEA